MNQQAGRQYSGNSGQALVENILAIPIIVMLLVAIFWYGRLLLAKQQLIMAARYGTDLIAYSNMDAKTIRLQIIDYLSGKDEEGRRLDPARLEDKNIRVNIVRCEKVTVTNIFKPMDYSPSSVEIYYDFEMPKLLSAWSGYLGGRHLPGRLRIAARSEVLAGTGCKGDSYK